MRPMVNSLMVELISASVGKPERQDEKPEILPSVLRVYSRLQNRLRPLSPKKL